MQSAKFVPQVLTGNKLMADTEHSLVSTVNLPSCDPALEKQDTSHLTAAQRESMMARAAILDRIDICSESFNKGAVIRQLIERCENSEPGSPLYELVKSANFKSGKGHPKLSRPTIFAWYKLRQKKGILGLAPKHSKVPNMSVPPWAPALLELYRQPSKPSMADCLRRLPEFLPADVKVPSYEQVRCFFKKLSKLALNKGRMGPQALKAMKAFTRRDRSELWPGAVYTADGHTFKATVEHPFHGQPTSI